MTRKWAPVLILVLLFSGCGGNTISNTPEEIEREVTVTRVVDGDTVEVQPTIDGTGDVRLIGIDTPETAASPDGPQPLGRKASEFTEQNLEGREVTLGFDVERKDDYGRALAYVFLPDGEMFNATLLERGYAQVATFPPNVEHLQQFKAAQREARRAERGIWALPEDQLCSLADRGNGIGGGCRN